jgi:hypothetical protein
VPQPVADLAARQAGESVELTFTLPGATAEGEPLESPPDVEIFRAVVAAGTTPEKARPVAKLVYTIPSALVDTYHVAEPDAAGRARMRFADPWPPDELARHAGALAVYVVRTRASARRASQDSNVVAVRLYPTAERIGALHLALTESAVELRWEPPARLVTGAPVSALAAYRIYRGELEPGAEAEAAPDPGRARWKSPPALLGVAPAASFRDTQFEFGRTYVYTARSVVQHDFEAVESADSPPAVVTPRDTFPPAAPANLVAVLVPATPEAPAHVELSWGISAKTDLAGYRVYRSEEGAARARQCLTQNLLPTPTFRDMGVAPGRRFTYAVAAVDRAGNESPHSEPVSVAIPERTPRP